jgi:hypothetical protein
MMITLSDASCTILFEVKVIDSCIDQWYLGYSFVQIFLRSMIILEVLAVYCKEWKNSSLLPIQEYFLEHREYLQSGILVCSKEQIIAFMEV